MEKGLFDHPGQVHCPFGQVTFCDHLPDGQGPVQASHLPTKLKFYYKKKNLNQHETACVGKAKFESFLSL